MDTHAGGPADARHLQRGDDTRTGRRFEAELQTVLTMRHRVQANAELEQPITTLPDSHSETDEMFQNAGGKR